MLAEAYPQLKAGGTGSNPVTRTNGHSIRNASGSAEMVPMWRMAITFGEWCSGNTTYLDASSNGSLQQIRFAFGSRCQRFDSSFPDNVTGVAQFGRATYLGFPLRKCTAVIFGL